MFLCLYIGAVVFKIKERNIFLQLTIFRYSFFTSCNFFFFVFTETFFFSFFLPMTFELFFLQMLQTNKKMTQIDSVCCKELW